MKRLANEEANKLYLSLPTEIKKEMHGYSIPRTEDHAITPAEAERQFFEVAGIDADLVTPEILLTFADGETTLELNGTLGKAEEQCDRVIAVASKYGFLAQKIYSAGLTNIDMLKKCKIDYQVRLCRNAPDLAQHLSEEARQAL